MRRHLHAGTMKQDCIAPCDGWNAIQLELVGGRDQADVASKKLGVGVVRGITAVLALHALGKKEGYWHA